MQMFLGIIQVLFFLVLLFNYDKFSNEIKNLLLIYGMLTITYALIFFQLPEAYQKGNWLLIAIIPMIIGSFFHLYRIST